ncbi:MAG: response regulator [Acidobacteria bacterium]|nr:response regulator [Acidobacteriota bacterium]
MGAFWGAGKPIIVYLAEASLTDDELPQIVQGDAWERRIAKIADRTKEIASQYDDSDSTPKGPSSIAQLTVEQLQKIIIGAVSLAAASRKDRSAPSNLEEVGSAVRDVAGKVLAGFQASEAASRDSRANWRNQILWVDDRPDNNLYERRAMEAMGLEFTLAESTAEALEILASRRFAAVISDMGRREGPREGYKLLEALRTKDKTTPFLIYAGSNAVQHKREALSRGAQGSTNRAEELVDMVMRSLPSETDIRLAFTHNAE